MNIKTLLTDEEIQDLTDKVASPHWLTLGEKVGLSVILALQDAKTKRVMVEWLIEHSVLTGAQKGWHISFTEETWQEFKKWALGE